MRMDRISAVPTYLMRLGLGLRQHLQVVLKHSMTCSNQPFVGAQNQRTQFTGHANACEFRRSSRTSEQPSLFPIAIAMWHMQIENVAQIKYIDVVF